MEVKYILLVAVLMISLVSAAPQYNKLEPPAQDYLTLADLATIEYLPTSFNFVAGTLVAGNLTSIQYYNGDTLNFTETGGTPAFDLRINFTNVSDFNQIVFRFRTNTPHAHTIYLQLWDYDENIWEPYYNFNAFADYNTVTLSVYDAEEHINNSEVRVRLYDSSAGNPSYVHYLDWFVLTKGFGTPASNEVDPLSIHLTAEGNLNVNNSDTVDGYHASQLAKLGEDNTFTGTQYINPLTKIVSIYLDERMNGGFGGFGDYVIYDNGNFSFLHYDDLITNFIYGNSIKSTNAIYYGNVSADKFIGNGSLLTGVCLSNGTGCASSGGDNSSWNQTYADTLYLNRSSESLYTTTYNSTYNNLIGQTCPSGQVVNGTYTNGSLKCQTVSSGAYNASYVPYTGATTDVDLGSRNLNANKITVTSNLELVKNYANVLDINVPTNGAIRFTSGGTSGQTAFQYFGPSYTGLNSQFYFDYGGGGASNGAAFWRNMYKGQTVAKFDAQSQAIFYYNVSVNTGSSYSGRVVCYTTNGVLGHCTDATNSTGGCTCVAN